MGTKDAEVVAPIGPRLKCQQCGRSSWLNAALTIRPLFGLEEVTEVGVKCPHCGHYIRAYWDHPNLQYWREKMNKATSLDRPVAKARYQAEYDRLQMQVAKHLGDPGREAEEHLIEAIEKERQE